MILINDVVFGYKSNHPVINGITLQLPTGKIHGIAGLNGSGKTTLLHLLFGLLKPDAGQINCSRFALTKKVMAMLPAENHFYSFITAKEYLSLFENKTSEIEKWNELFQIPLHQILDEFSSGMKKKVAIMGVICQNKQIMLLDEPFNNLDIETSRLLRELFLRLKDTGKTLIITSHIIETLTNLCDEIHYLDSGKIKMSFNKDDFDKFESSLFAEIEIKNRTKLDGLLGRKQSEN
jgi:ABC-2 type transport system ATP-binding protein